jgi:hypothetical protein
MGICSFELLNQDIDMLIDAFHKVWNNFDELKKFNRLTLRQTFS